MAFLTKIGYRDQYNPLRGLSLARIVQMEDAAERGDWSDLQWLWRHMIQTDVTTKSALAKRLSHMESLDWEIVKNEGGDPVLMEEQEAVLRYAYDRIDNLSASVVNVARALFTGYSHIEKVRTGYGPFISRLDYIDPWFWNWDPTKKRWLFNPTAEQGFQRGEPVEDKDLIIYAPMDPLMKSIGRHFFAKMLAMADWDTALENGANQAIFISGPPGTPPAKELEYQAMAEAWTSNMRGYLPHQSEVHIEDLAARSKLPYIERIDYSDKQIVMAATGGILTMLTESGSGTLAGGAHENGLLQLARSDAQRVTEVFQKAIDKETLNAFFPGRPHQVYFKLDIPQPQETMQQIIDLTSGLSWAGYRPAQAWLEEKLGTKLEQIQTPGA